MLSRRTPARPARWIGLVLAGVILCQAPIGCGTKPPATVPVKGTLTYQGRKGAVAALQFWPQEVPGARVIEVFCDRKGEFSFACPPGRYKITASPPQLANEEPDPNFPSAYTDPQSTPVDVIIPENGIEGLLISFS